MTNETKTVRRPSSKSVIQYNELLVLVQSVSTEADAKNAWMKLISLMKENESRTNWNVVAMNMVRSMLKSKNKFSSKCKYSWERFLGSVIASVHERKKP